MKKRIASRCKWYAVTEKNGKRYLHGYTAKNTVDSAIRRHAIIDRQIAKQYQETKTDPIITAETVFAKACAITIRALLTNLKQSGNGMILKLYHSAVNFSISNGRNSDGNGGADLVQDTAVYLWEYNGKALTDTTTDGQKDKDGQPITILRGAFRNIRKRIYAHEQRQMKQVYIEDYTENHGEIAIPFEWDLDCYEDFATVDRVLQELQLTENQKRI
jgi:hypothetical protein